MTEHSLAEVVAQRAALLEGAEPAAIAGGTEWRLDGVAFATLGPTGAEFRLRREVAAAALRTPDVTASPRGGSWVAFAPAALDGFAVDRAQAWLESAWRFADARALSD